MMRRCVPPLGVGVPPSYRKRTLPPASQPVPRATTVHSPYNDHAAHADSGMSDRDVRTRLREYFQHLKRYNTARNVQALKLWEEWVRVAEAGGSNGQHAFQYMLATMAALRQDEFVAKLWREMKATPALVTLGAYQTMMQYYAHLRDPRGQAAILEHMDSRGVAPDAVIFVAIIRCQILLKDVPAAKDAYREMLARGVAPLPMTFQTLIAAVPFDEALAYIREMQRRGMPVDDIYTLMALIDACSISRDAARAEAVFAGAPQQPPPPAMFKKMMWVHMASADTQAAYGMFARAEAAKVRLPVDFAHLFTTYLKKRVTGVVEGADGGTTVDDYLELADALYERFGRPPHMIWLREMLRLAVAARRPDFAKRYIGVLNLNNIGFNPGIQECIDKLGLGHLQPVDVSLHRGRAEKTWHMPPPPVRRAPAGGGRSDAGARPPSPPRTPRGTSPFAALLRKPVGRD